MFETEIGYSKWRKNRRNKTNILEITSLVDLTGDTAWIRLGIEWNKSRMIVNRIFYDSSWTFCDCSRRDDAGIYLFYSDLVRSMILSHNFSKKNIGKIMPNREKEKLHTPLQSAMTSRLWHLATTLIAKHLSGDFQKPNLFDEN